MTFQPDVNIETPEHNHTSKEQASGDFGLCPHCRNNDGYVNVGRGHWFVCDEHKVMWFAGTNLFSSWRDETDEEQRRAWAARGLDEYSDIEPYYPPQEDSEDSQKDRAHQLCELCDHTEHDHTITRENIDALSFGLLRNLKEAYCCDQPEHVVPIKEVIAAPLTVRRALQQSGSWKRLMDIIG
jgi:hypothetical protein